MAGNGLNFTLVEFILQGEESPIRIAIIGFGVIGKSVYSFLEKTSCEVFVYDRDKEALSQVGKNAHLTSDKLIQQPFDLVVEAASVEAVHAFAPAIIQRSSLLILSVAAFADQVFLEKMKALSGKSGKKILIPEGALIGSQVLIPLREELKEVSLKTCKHPRSLGRSDDQAVIVFDGQAKEACRRFPRNLNIAATLALYGLGFDRTQVTLLSDPEAHHTRHEVKAQGAFGRLSWCIESAPSRENPRTSSIAVKSVIQSLEKFLMGQDLPDLVTLCSSW